MTTSSAVQASTIARTPWSVSDVPASGSRLGNVFRSEWTKLWSVRSTRWTVAATVAATVGFSVLYAATTVAGWAHRSPAARASFDPTSYSLGGLYFGQLAIAALGALALTSEYSTGGIRSSFVAVPQRWKVLASKAGVVAVVGLGTGLASTFAAFFAGQAFFAREGAAAQLGDPGVLRAVLGGALYVAGCGLLGYALGTLLRHSAAALTSAAGLLFVLPLLANLLPGAWGRTAQQYILANAGTRITAVRPLAGLSPWAGYAVFTAQWVVILAAGVILIQRRDA